MTRSGRSEACIYLSRFQFQIKYGRRVRFTIPACATAYELHNFFVPLPMEVLPKMVPLLQRVASRMKVDACLLQEC